MSTTGHFRVLRLRYQAAFTTYKQCVETRNEELTAGREPSDEMRAIEEAALRELQEARDRLLRAM